LAHETVPGGSRTDKRAAPPSTAFTQYLRRHNLACRIHKDRKADYQGHLLSPIGYQVFDILQDYTSLSSKEDAINIVAFISVAMTDYLLPNIVPVRARARAEA
jgi:hypothetical protein